MATNLKDLIDLSLLTYYDSKIKDYIANQIVVSDKEIVITTKTELPVKGDKDVLYIVEDSVMIWNGTKYTDVITQSSSSIGTWGSF